LHDDGGGELLRGEVLRVVRFYVKMRALKDFLRDERGQDLVEYALVVGLIAMGAVAAMNGFATTIVTGFTSIGTKVTGYTS
jgi:pilus assembly protein Flp/PilA